MKELEKYENFKDLKDSKSKDKKETPDEKLKEFYKALRDAHTKGNSNRDDS